MLYQRVLTGIILGAIVLGLVVIGDAWFIGLISLLGIIAYSELLSMKGYRIFDVPSVAGFILVEAWLLFGVDWLDKDSAGLLLWIVFGLLFLTVLMKNRFTFQDVSYVFLGSLYIGLSLHFSLELRQLTNGLPLFLFVLFAIWGTDVGAYFVGRFVKGPKLWPSISPNKTISGSAGGLLMAMLVGFAFYKFFSWGHPLSQWFILSAAISISGQVGDFVESGVKRSLNVKDSGSLLPGHGGVLDRFDSLLFAAPIAFYLMVYVFHF